jgi:hypothetical protein
MIPFSAMNPVEHTEAAIAELERYATSAGDRAIAHLLMATVLHLDRLEHLHA